MEISWGISPIHNGTHHMHRLYHLMVLSICIVCQEKRTDRKYSIFLHRQFGDINLVISRSRGTPFESGLAYEAQDLPGNS